MRYRCLLLLFLLLLPLAASAETAWLADNGEVQAGEAQYIGFTFDGAEAAITVLDAYGQTVLTQRMSAAEGENAPTGVKGELVLSGGELAPGQYVLRLFSEGRLAQRQLTVTAPAPRLTLVQVDGQLNADWGAVLDANVPGRVTVSLEDGAEVMRMAVDAGETSLDWFGPELGAGSHTLTFILTDEAGNDSAPQTAQVTVRSTLLATDAAYFSPDDLSGVTCGHEACYWRLNMGEMDEDAIWQALIAPVTVLDGDERHQCKVRREPSEDCKDYVGEVTYASQAVHVLERGDKWTLIEAYSSSVEGSSVAVWARQFRGYVKTSLLKEVKVSQEVGLVIDKLQQRLYVFKDGRLFSTLICSTGFARDDTPFNESPAGEFLAISWTGGFWSGSLYCDMAIRINDGILLHEVPCLLREQADGSKLRDYERCERYLGEKASHGCIRIQRASSPEHVNAKWLWDNLPRTGAKAKVLIWDDWGRTLAYPDDKLQLYYNPNGGKQYHSDPRCAAVNERHWPLTPFFYGELDSSPYSKLTRCPACAPQLSHAEIDTLNSKNKRGK